MFDVLHGGRHDELRDAARGSHVALPDPGTGADPLVGYVEAVREGGARHRARGDGCSYADNRGAQDSSP